MSEFLVVSLLTSIQFIIYLLKMLLSRFIEMLLVLNLLLKSNELFVIITFLKSVVMVIKIIDVSLLPIILRAEVI